MLSALAALNGVGRAERVATIARNWAAPAQRDPEKALAEGR